MQRGLVLLLVISLMLSGCSMFSDSYISVTPHQNSSDGGENKVMTASNYTQLREAFSEMVRNGTESGIIHVSDYHPALLEQGLQDAVHYIQKYDAIGAYCVESVEYEKGTSGIVPAVAVTIRYLHDRRTIQQIPTVRNFEELWDMVETALDRCEAGIVAYVESYTEQDLIQMVEDYCGENPAGIMETPQVSYELYPKSGRERVVAIKFAYQNSRTDLRQMQSQVQPIFNSAVQYAKGGSDYQILQRLYAFLMERFTEYQIKTSITPSYSLLHHGVGDSRAFAMVYAQMCRMAGVDSRVVTGTYQGEPWCWNMVESDGCFYHVDLLNSHTETGFGLLVDEQMEDYVWDYSVYPACAGVPEAE